MALPVLLMLDHMHEVRTLLQGILVCFGDSDSAEVTLPRLVRGWYPCLAAVFAAPAVHLTHVVDVVVGAVSEAINASLGTQAGTNGSSSGLGGPSLNLTVGVSHKGTLLLSPLPRLVLRDNQDSGTSLRQKILYYAVRVGIACGVTVVMCSIGLGVWCACKGRCCSGCATRRWKPEAARGRRVHHVGTGLGGMIKLLRQSCSSLVPLRVTRDCHSLPIPVGVGPGDRDTGQNATVYLFIIGNLNLPTYRRWGRRPSCKPWSELACRPSGCQRVRFGGQRQR